MLLVWTPGHRRQKQRELGGGVGGSLHRPSKLSLPTEAAHRGMVTILGKMQRWRGVYPHIVQIRNLKIRG